MLSEMENIFYDAVKKNIRVTLTDGNVLEGYCSEFSTAYDNDEPEEASITITRGRRVKTGEVLYPRTEIYESKIKKIEYLD